eukprot:TRINITY_DN6059_c0_g1_i1.p1 TRINITY_DN6059_c0_g1~~TRINITY_DN6059_c0_g1_i1.p1  ORF type:complete len:780 (+),score=161.61 TRINITY_DN6059_c0_g1_i1:224-2563(+)
MEETPKFKNVNLLEEMKSNSNLFFGFYSFTSAQMCLESLHFILEVESYRDHCFAWRTQKELEIANRYVKVGAMELINITMVVKEKILDGLGFANKNLFDEAQSVCIKLLQGDSWFEFHKTEDCKKASDNKPLKGKALEKAIRTLVAPHVYNSAIYVFCRKRIEESIPLEISEEKQKHIVILGGGVLGITIAKLLRKPKKYLISVVDKKSYFRIHEECIPCYFDTKPDRIQQQTTYYYNHMFSGLRIDFYEAEVIKVTPEKVLTSKCTLMYDALVICTGVTYRKSNLDNAYELNYYSPGAMDLHTVVEKSKKFMVVGKGLPAINLSAWVANNPNNEITLVHSGKELLPALSPETEEKVKKYLKGKGVVILHNTLLSVEMNKEKGKYVMELIPSEPTETRVRYPAKKLDKTQPADIDKRPKPSDKKVSESEIPMVKHTLTVSPLFASLEVETILICDDPVPNSKFMERHFSESLTPNKFLKVNPFFQLQDSGISNIFAGGDVVYFNDEAQDDKDLTQVLKHSKYIYQNVKAYFTGKPMREHRYAVEKQKIISLGPQNAIVTDESGKAILEGEAAMKAKTEYLNSIKAVLGADAKANIAYKTYTKERRREERRQKIVVLALSEPTIALTNYLFNNGVAISVITKTASTSQLLSPGMEDCLFCIETQSEEKLVNFIQGVNVVIISPEPSVTMVNQFELFSPIFNSKELNCIISLNPFSIALEQATSPISKLTLEFETVLQTLKTNKIIIRYGLILDLFLRNFEQSIRKTRNAELPSFSSTWVN